MDEYPDPLEASPALGGDDLGARAGAGDDTGCVAPSVEMVRISTRPVPLRTMSSLRAAEYDRSMIRLS